MVSYLVCVVWNVLSSNHVRVPRNLIAPVKYTINLDVFKPENAIEELLIGGMQVGTRETFV